MAKLINKYSFFLFFITTCFSLPLIKKRCKINNKNIHDLNFELEFKDNRKVNKNIIDYSDLLFDVRFLFFIIMKIEKYQQKELILRFQY